MSQSRLDTRPSSCEGTWRCLTVAQAIVPAVSKVLNSTLASINPHSPLDSPYPATATVATVQVRYMNVSAERGRPSSPIATAHASEPSPPAAKISPRSRAPSANWCLTMNGRSTSVGPMNSR